ncbi:MAG: PAS domain S-box protein [Nitrospirota bacterium]|nr:PAS domain S-box protein [Nitrospirota bacterium]
MSPVARKRNTVALTAILLVTAGIFLLDLLTPLGMAAGSLYMIPLLFTPWAVPLRLPAVLGAFSTLLIVLGALFSPPGASPDMVLFNRTVAIIALWVAVWMLTMKNRAVQHLHQAQTRLTGILDNALDAVIEMDEAGRITDWNQRAEVIFGWTAHEAIGRKIDETIIPVEYREAHRQGLRRFLATGESRVFDRRLELTALRRDGRLFPVELSILPVKIGAEYRFSAFVSDTTLRKQAEEERRKVLQDRLLLLESTGEGIFGIDRQGRCTFINRAGAAMLGYSADDMLGRDMHELIHHTRRDGSPYPIADCPIAHARQNGEKCRLTDEVLWRRDRTSFSAEFTAHPVIEHGRILGAVVTFADITARKRSEQAFHSLVEGTAAAVGHEFFHSLVQHLAAALEVRYALLGEFTDDAKTRVRTLAVWDGARFLDNFEYPIADAPCEGVLDASQWFYPRDIRARFPRARLLADLGVESYLGTRLTGPTGQTIGLLAVLHTAPMPEDNIAPALLKVFAARAAAELERLRMEDALRRSEDHLRQAQKMEAVGRLAGGIAHDFNNLLMVLNGYGEVLLDKLDPASPLHHYALEITKAGERAASLTEQLLAFSRRQTAHPQVLDLNGRVTAMRDMLARLLGERIELVATLAPDLAHIRADRGQIEQVIMNLAINARDAMPQGGRLTITTANTSLAKPYSGSHSLVQPGAYATLTVHDTGHGMDAETLSHVFEPFFTTKAQGKGTGLGLAIAYGIVEQSGGHIDVRSTTGEGTTFSIYLPQATDMTEARSKPQAAGEPARGTETILVVDDMDAVRLLTRKCLEDAGYQVMEASHGTEALTLGKRHPGPIHLLLTDVVMPQMNGPELADSLAHTHPETKVLFMTGYTDDVLFQQEGPTRKAPLLHKPVSPATLIRTVHDLLAASR